MQASVRRGHFDLENAQDQRLRPLHRVVLSRHTISGRLRAEQ
jgi:hypothetical protein